MQSLFYSELWLGGMSDVGGVLEISAWFESG